MLFSTLIGFGQNGNINSVIIKIEEGSQKYETLIVEKYSSERKGNTELSVDSIRFQFEIKKIGDRDGFTLWSYSSQNHSRYVGNNELMKVDTKNRSYKILPATNYLCSPDGEYVKLENWKEDVSRLNLDSDYFQDEGYFQKLILYELKLVHFLRGMKLEFNHAIKTKSYLLMDNETGGGRFHMPTDVTLSIDEFNSDSTQIKVKASHQIDYQSLYGFPVELMIQGALNNNPGLTREELESKLMREIGVEIFELNFATKELLEVNSEYLWEVEEGTSIYHRYELRKKD